MACDRGLIKGAFLCTKRTLHFDFTTREGLKITLSHEKKKKEKKKARQGGRENIKTDIPLNVYVICFGDPISIARREKKKPFSSIH